MDCRPYLSFLAPLLLALASPACTVSRGTVSASELERLARADPSERGERVLVLEQTLYDGYDPGPTAAAAVNVALSCSNIPPVQGLERECNLPVVPVRTSSSSDDDDDDDDDGDAGNAAAVAAIAFVLAGTLLAPIAVTEGLRFDGWADLDPHQPLYLVQGRRWVLLSDLEASDLAPGERAVLPNWQSVRRLERRPLDRVGFAFGLELAMARLSAAPDPALWGYGGRITLGGHPFQELGLFAGGHFAYGKTSSEERFLGRAFGSVEYLPLALGVFHAGLFAEAGQGWLFAKATEGSTASGLYGGGGPLFQFALSTRLTLTLRAALQNVSGPDGRYWVPEAGVGLTAF
jgi:hypothetical protein